MHFLKKKLRIYISPDVWLDKLVETKLTSQLTEFLHIIDISNEPRSLVADPGGTREKTEEKNSSLLDNSDSKSSKRPSDGSASISKKVGVFFLALVIDFEFTFMAKNRC